MVKPINRRSFLVFAGSMAVAAPVLKGLIFDRVVAQTPPNPFPPQETPVIPDKYLDGVVTAVGKEDLSADTFRGALTIQLPAASDIWKGGFGTDIPIEVGDRFYAWGDLTDDANFAAEKIHFNIRNEIGPVSDLALTDTGDASFVLAGRSGQFQVITSDRTMVVREDGSEVAFRNVGNLIAPGSLVQVLGLARAGKLEATIVYPSF